MKKTDVIHTSTDATEVDGLTVGLVDGLITNANLIAQRNLSSASVREALKNLQDDSALRKLLDMTAN